MVVADHVQRVMKPNFAASWEEIGEENQVEETFALSTMKDIPGELVWSGRLAITKQFFLLYMYVKAFVEKLGRFLATIIVEISVV